MPSYRIVTLPVVLGKGVSCEKDIRLVGRKFERRGKELRKRQSGILSGDEWKKQGTEMILGSSFTSGFDVDEFWVGSLVRM